MKMKESLVEGIVAATSIAWRQRQRGVWAPAWVLGGCGLGEGGGGERRGDG